MLTGISSENTKKAIEDIIRASLNTRYVDNTTDAEKVQYGEMVILDDGNVTQRVYVRTGKNNVIYFTGTLV